MRFFLSYSLHLSWDPHNDTNFDQKVSILGIVKFSIPLCPLSFINDIRTVFLVSWRAYVSETLLSCKWSASVRIKVPRNNFFEVIRPMGLTWVTSENVQFHHLPFLRVSWLWRLIVLAIEVSERREGRRSIPRNHLYKKQPSKPEKCLMHPGDICDFPLCIL